MCGNKCGNEIDDEAVVCGKWGVPATPGKSVSSTSGQGGGWNTAVMVGACVGTLIIPLIGIVMGIIGLIKHKEKSQGGVLLGLGILMMLVYIGMSA